MLKRWIVCALVQIRQLRPNVEYFFRVASAADESNFGPYQLADSAVTLADPVINSIGIVDATSDAQNVMPTDGGQRVFIEGRNLGFSLIARFNLAVRASAPVAPNVLLRTDRPWSCVCVCV
jgi:hypothetical protein